MAIANLLKKKINESTLQSKAVNREFRDVQNQLFEALYAWFGKDQPIPIGDNPASYIKDAYARNSDVYSIISYKNRVASNIPMKLEIRKSKSGEWEESTEHDAHGLIQQPNKDMNYMQFVNAFGCFRDITGNGYAYGIPPEFGPNKGKIQEIHVMPSHFTEIIFGSVIDPVQGYRIYIGAGQQGPPIPKEQVLHIKYFNPEVSLNAATYGMSPIKAASMLVRKSNDSYTAEAKSFENMGPPVIITKRETGGFTPEQMEILREEYKAKYTGPSRTGIPLFTGAIVDAIRLGLSPVDLQILESQKLTFEQLCRPFRFPVTILDSKSATLDNNKIAEKRLYVDCILPDMWELADGLTGWIGPQYKEEIRYTIDTSEIEVLQEDKGEMVQWLKEAYWIRTSTKQQMLGEEVDNKLPEYFIPSNLVPWGEEFMANDGLEDSEEKMKQLRL